jgi:predicted transcriptional regulator of viral defense system
MTKQVHTIQGIELARKIAQEGFRVFTAADAQTLITTVGLSKNYLNEALFHLVHSGWLLRLRKGLYAFSSLMPGLSPVHEFEIAMALTKPAAISHWSALHYHGLSEQIPHHVFILTTSPSNTPRRATKANNSIYFIEKTGYRFIRAKPERYFGIQKAWIGEAQIVITDPERTLLDGLMKPQYCGDFSEVLHAFQVHLPKLDIKKIIDYALQLDIVTAKRLGWVLEYLGISISKLEPLARLPIKGYRPLDATGPRKGVCNPRWYIQENLRGKIIA